MSRARADSPEYFFTCTPKGSKATKDPMEWLRAVMDLAAVERCDKRESIRQTALHLVCSRNPVKYTTSPLWTPEALAPFNGLSRSAWHRNWLWMKANGLLGEVAHGREARFKPKKYQDEGNDKAVYLFAIPTWYSGAEPAVPTEPTEADKPVDKSETLHPLEGNACNLNPRPRENNTENGGAKHRLKSTSGGSAARPCRLLPPLPKIWRGDITAKAALKNRAEARESQVEFARTLKHFVPALNSSRFSDKHLAAVLRKANFFAAAWTVNDIRFALDRRPDGTPWPHSGADGIGNLAKWLAYRLEPWRDEHGWPIQSPYQRQRTIAAEARARAKADAEKRERNNASREKGLVSGKFAAGIAALRAALADAKKASAA